MKRGFEMYLNVKISKTNAKEPKKGFLFGKKGLIPFLRLSVTSTLNRGLVARGIITGSKRLFLPTLCLFDSSNQVRLSQKDFGWIKNNSFPSSLSPRHKSLFRWLPPLPCKRQKRKGAFILVDPLPQGWRKQRGCHLPHT